MVSSGWAEMKNYLTVKQLSFCHSGSAEDFCLDQIPRRIYRPIWFCFDCLVS